MRIEKYFADFWYKAALVTMQLADTCVSCGYAVVELVNGPLNSERDVAKYYNKLFDDKSMARNEKVRFLKVFTDAVEVYQHPNSVNPLLQLDFADIKSITLLRSCFCYKLALHSKPDLEYEQVLIFSSDEEELKKWRSVFVHPYELSGAGEVDEIDSLETTNERRMEFMSWGATLFDFNKLESFINNSEFIMNPEADDKLMIFDRVSETHQTFTDELIKNIKSGAKNS